MPFPIFTISKEDHPLAGEDFFVEQIKYSGTCALTSFYNAGMGRWPFWCITPAICNKIRLWFEASTTARGAEFLKYAFGGATGWWTMEVIFKIAAAVGIRMSRVRYGRKYSDPEEVIKRIDLVHATIQENALKGKGMMILLGRAKLDAPNHVIAVRNNVVFDGEMKKPIPVSEYPNLIYAKRVYQIDSCPV